MSSRLRAVHIFTLTYEKPMFLVRRPSPAALACAACSFLNKTALSPRRRAHFASNWVLSNETSPIGDFRTGLPPGICDMGPPEGRRHSSIRCNVLVSAPGVWETWGSRETFPTYRGSGRPFQNIGGSSRYFAVGATFLEWSPGRPST